MSRGDIIGKVKQVVKATSIYLKGGSTSSHKLYNKGEINGEKSVVFLSSVSSHWALFKS